MKTANIMCARETAAAVKLHACMRHMFKQTDLIDVYHQGSSSHDAGCMLIHVTAKHIVSYMAYCYICYRINEAR